ncbi:MAG TPA: MerR family transcriptional regulator [Cellulomonadaceae bacterium]|nr:MerR family transcriptional regulator [Cellulomonadaceae bacterium]
MLTIGQLASYTGVSAKTVRFYHTIGLLVEPARDASGYRRYAAADAIALVKIRALAEAGVPLAQIPALLTAGPQERVAALERIDDDLERQVTRLHETRRRLRGLAVPRSGLPPGVQDYLDLLAQIGLSAQWIGMERDLWLLAFATHPQSAALLLAEQHEAKTLPEVQQVYRDYDSARGLDPDDPDLKHLAGRILRIAHDRYSDQPAPEPPVDSPIPRLMQDMINGASPAWRRVDHYLRTGTGDLAP